MMEAKDENAFKRWCTAHNIRPFKLAHVNYVLLDLTNLQRYCAAFYCPRPGLLAELNARDAVSEGSVWLRMELDTFLDRIRRWDEAHATR